MPLDFDILKKFGTTNEAFREFFLAKPPTPEQEAKLPKEDVAAMRERAKKRQDFEDMIGGWLQEHIFYTLQNHAMFTAADMAWDSAPINRNTMPLMQFAQGRIDVGIAERALQDVPDGSTYVKKNSAGQVVGIDLPKFTEMNVNIVRSVISRRVAAQVAKYEVWPHFKYEPRDGSQVGRLRADMVSQRMDIMADQFGYPAQVEQICRDMLLYPNGCTVFPRCSWERDVQYRKVDVASEFQQREFDVEAYSTREGVCWVLPHQSRVFSDNNHATSTINTDTGCEYIGYWDIDRWGNVKRNPTYFNQDRVSFSADSAAWFTQYGTYFRKFFDRIIPPANEAPAGDANDRKNVVGLYSQQQDNVSCFLTNLFVKLIPKNWGVGEYPYPIWLHLKCAGDNTVVYADIMPSSAAASFRFNCNDGRLNNISMAHELMQYQDQLTNLYSQLIQTIQADLFAVAILNEDIFPDDDDGRKAKAEFKRIMSGNAWHTSMQVLTTSFDKLQQLLGREITADMVFKVVRTSPNTAITAIFEAIARVIAMAERLMVLSPHEQGQAATHEISATESNQIATSTDAIYNYISASMDRGRAAMKRICYDSFIAKAVDDVSLPVSKRYPKSTIAKAGFKVLEQDGDDDSTIGFFTVGGKKINLLHDYIFTSRDGGNRASNSAAANSLVQLITPFVTSNPSAQNAILSAMGKEKLFEVINAIFRLADASVDLNLEVKPGDDDSLLLEDDQQVMTLIQQLAANVKQNTQNIAQIMQAFNPQQPQQ